MEKGHEFYMRERISLWNICSSSSGHSVTFDGRNMEKLVFELCEQTDNSMSYSKGFETHFEATL